MYCRFLGRDFGIGWNENVNILGATSSSYSSVFGPKFALVLDFSLFAKFGNAISNTDSSRQKFFGWPRRRVHTGGWTRLHGAIG